MTNRGSRRRNDGKPRWLIARGPIIILILLVGIGVVFYYLVALGWPALLKSLGFKQGQISSIRDLLADTDQPPRAEVIVGSKLAWQTIAKGSLFGSSLNGKVVIGQFDQDPDDELLFAGYDGHSTIYEVDGSHRQVRIALGGFVLYIVSWDYNGDGLDEVVTDRSLSEHYKWIRQSIPQQYSNINASLVTPVFDLDGQILDLLQCNMVWTSPVLGDFNGDGKTDLMLFDSQYNGKAKRLYYSTNGVKLATDLLPFIGISTQAGDIDGDGKDEVVESVDKSNTAKPRIELRVYGPGRPAAPLAPTIEGYQFYLLDANHDGKLEVMTGYDRYENLDGTQQVKLQYPGQLQGAVKPNFNAYLLDLLGTGEPQIVVLYGPDYFQCAVLAFAANGQCLYYEELGEAIQSSGVASAGGKRYFVVHTSNRIMVYPEQ